VITLSDVLRYLVGEASLGGDASPYPPAETPTAREEDGSAITSTPLLPVDERLGRVAEAEAEAGAGEDGERSAERNDETPRAEAPPVEDEKEDQAALGDVPS
jgi:hypothetical protein